MGSSTIDLTPADVDVRARAGYAISRDFTITDESGAAIDVTGWTWEAWVEAEDGTDIALTVTVTSATDGELTISATAATLSAAVAGGTHYWGLDRTDTDEAMLAGRWIVETDPRA